MMTKALLRRQASAARQSQTLPKACAQAVYRHLISQDWYQAAHTVLWYVGCRSELPTVDAIEHELQGSKTIVVPYCTTDDAGYKTLGLWRLVSLAELVPGCWNILEPPADRRREIDRIIQPSALDLVIVPGVAFDMAGGRLGNGAGYYDRFLRSVRPDCILVGVGFHGQLVEQVPIDAHDIYMDVVITEQGIFSGKGR